MVKKVDPFGLSPTVNRVIKEFSVACRSDETIENEIAESLEKVLCTGNVPKPHEIKLCLLATWNENQVLFMYTHMQFTYAFVSSHIH